MGRSVRTGRPAGLAREKADLPPGQRALASFPRFGTHLHRPPPTVPADPQIEVSGEVRATFELPVARLGEMPRRQLVADFHCVSGWSATDLRWEGVAFAEFYRRVIEPELVDKAEVTHLVFGGLDGHESVVMLEDAMAEAVTLADRLDGQPLGSDHGAPVRLLSPGQYGYMSTKHLCRIEVLSSRPSRNLGAATRFARAGLRGPVVMRHPRARVWEEERHPYVRGSLLRPLYRLAIRPGIELGARAAKRRG